MTSEHRSSDRRHGGKNHGGRTNRNANTNSANNRGNRTNNSNRTNDRGNRDRRDNRDKSDNATRDDAMRETSWKPRKRRPKPNPFEHHVFGSRGRRVEQEAREEYLRQSAARREAIRRGEDPDAEARKHDSSTAQTDAKPSASQPSGTQAGDTRHAAASSDETTVTRRHTRPRHQRHDADRDGSRRDGSPAGNPRYASKAMKAARPADDAQPAHAAQAGDIVAGDIVDTASAAEAQTAAEPQPADGRDTQYFSENPAAEDRRRIIGLDLRGHEASMEVSAGVFSSSRLDLGTRVLLRHAPEPPSAGTFLDLGCGWGPIAVALAKESPKADVWAVDVNERALELTRENAARNACPSVHAAKAEDVPAGLAFDVIWSNPPIRIGKEALHALLMQWLPRLSAGGAAYLVVQKNLGADSLIPWLQSSLDELGATQPGSEQPGSEQSHDDAAAPAFTVSKYASSKGYRVIEVRRTA